MAFRAPSRSHLPRSLEIGVFHAPVAAQRKGLDRQTESIIGAVEVGNTTKEVRK